MRHRDYLQSYERYTVDGIDYVHLCDDHWRWWVTAADWEEMLADARAGLTDGDSYSDWVQDWGQVEGDLEDLLNEAADHPWDALELIRNYERGLHNETQSN